MLHDDRDIAAVTLTDVLQRLLAGAVGQDELWRSHRGQAVRIGAGKIVYHQSDPSDAVYLLVDGELRAFVGEGSETKTTLLLRAPAVFGDRDVLVGEHAAESVVSLGASRLFIWQAQSFEAEFTSNALLRQVLWDDMARRYTRSLELGLLQLSTVDVRIAATTHEASGHQESMPIEYMAMIWGISTRSVARALANLRRAPGIEQEQQRLFHSIRRTLVRANQPLE
ncbi:MAG: Crp/Fnr family transcriptional regulator [Myxococcota bacterium]